MQQERRLNKNKMVERFICPNSQLGPSLTELTVDEVKERPRQATGLTPKDLSMIMHMKQRGHSLEQISIDTGAGLEVLKKFFLITETEGTQIDALNQGKGQISLGQRAYNHDSPDHCKAYSRSPPTTTEETKQPPQPSKPLPKPQHSPTFLYCCQGYFNKLRRVNLLTGEQSRHQIPGFHFKYGCSWSELPGGSLLITGGGYPAEVREVEKIDTLREWAVSSQPPMHTPRRHFAAVYHSQYLYVLGGCTNERYLRESERYSCAEREWEVLPALPVAGWGMSAVEVENSVYALGGYDGGDLDTVQKLSLDSLTWTHLRLKLPQTAFFFPCFKTDSQVYLVIEDTLYSFTPLQVKPIKKLAKGISCSSSYYSRGTLYYAKEGCLASLALGI